MPQEPKSPFLNPKAKDFVCSPPSYPQTLEAFHKSLPTYATTPLHKLPASISESLGLDSIYLKDESMRFGLPSFKILGASWAVYRAMCQRLGISVENGNPDSREGRQTRQKLPVSLEQVSVLARKAGIRLVLCTDGNWGRAVAFTATLLGVEAVVFVPDYVDEATRALISSEGAEVRICDGDYDDAIQAAIQEANEGRNATSPVEGSRNLLVMDTSWEGYEEIPGWVTQGYQTMLEEIEEQRNPVGHGSLELRGYKQPDLVVVSVGVGSWAHAVVQHYKSFPKDNRPLIVTVEPENAASLMTSLQHNNITPIATSPTIMAGMNCGTTSRIAWPFLRDGVDLALTVSDRESHEAVVQLREECGLESGPCGAAPFAALKKILSNKFLEHEVFRRDTANQRSISVILFSTEGRRIYDIPTEAS